jgi:hypothetical protein
MHAVQQQNARIYLDHQSIVEEGPKELLVEPDVFHAPIVFKRTHASALPQ